MSTNYSSSTKEVGSIVVFFPSQVCLQQITLWISTHYKTFLAATSTWSWWKDKVQLLYVTTAAVKPYSHFLYLSISIYLYTWLIYPLKGDSQDKAFRIQGDFILSSPSAPCLFVGKITVEGLPRPLALSLLVTFYEPQGIRRWYSCSPHHRAVY